MKLNFILLLLLLLRFNAEAQDTPTGMAKVLGGKFIPLYGGDSIPVVVQDFYMDRFQVTNADFLVFVAQYSQWQKSQVKKLFVDINYLKHWDNDLDIGTDILQINNSPVVNISWFAANAYCQCQGKRLPTVNEWEFAARASEKKMDASGDEGFYQQSLDWYSAPNPRYLAAVDKGFKNFYGIYGLIGAVWEWTLDYNSSLITDESRTNSSIDRDAFCGGGSSGVKDVKNYVAFMRYAFRSSLKSNYTVANLGFRCVKDVNLPKIKMP